MRSLASVVLLVLISQALPAADGPAQQVACPAAERAANLESVQRRILARWESPRPYDSLSCIVVIVQNFRGEVLYAGIEGCEVDGVVARSLEDAAYEASPLPLPASKACREPEIRVRIEHYADPVQ